MGLMSRRVLPICGTLCVCCPALRARSRQPVKRYNMLLADFYPKSQDEAPNDRKIGKLVEYAVKNPLRIPKIATALEQKGQKELKNEHFGTVTTIMRAYSKLFIACRDEMSLIAINALNMIKALIEQPRHVNMRILGCMTLVDFIRVQTDATYMRNVDGLIPPLCTIAREHGDDKSRLPLKAAALQALAAMVGFMAQHSYSSADFNEIVAATLENYELPTELPSAEFEAMGMEKGEAEQVVTSEGHSRARQFMRDTLNKMHRHKAHANIKDPLTLTSEEAEAPSIWAQICIQNMAALAKEATTVRKVLDPMFRYFDGEKQWTLDRGLALIVLQNMQFLLDQTGNGHLLLAALVRHLDHKLVDGNLVTKRNIVALTAVLARQSKTKTTVAEVGAMSDLSKHLRRSLQLSMESPVGGSEENLLLQAAIEECLMEFGRRVGDAGPLLDMMAATLEKLPSEPFIARSTLQAVSVLALAVAHLPDHLYAHEEFPDSLFNGLLQAMLHPDMETRVWAHRIFMLLLVPSSVVRRGEQHPGLSKKWTVSAFSSAAALFERLRRERSFVGSDDEPERNVNKGGGSSTSMGRGVNMDKADSRSDSFGRDEVRSGREDTSDGAASPSRLQAFRLSFGRSMDHLRRPSASSKDPTEMTSARLSGNQAELLFSALWLQSKLATNWPSSYEAMAHTFSLALLFSRPKSLGHNTQLRALQLALSIRNLTFDSTAIPSLARRRSLFTLATGMLVFAARIYNIPQIVAPVKVPLTSLVKDPFVELSEDCSLISASSTMYAPEYATDSDETAAFNSLNLISLAGDLSNEAVAARIVEASPTLIEVEGAGMKERLTEKFVPEDSELLRSRLYSQSNARSAHASCDSISFDESQLTPAGLEDGRPSADLLPMLRDSVSSRTPQAPGVMQLLDQAQQVELTPAPSGPLSYNDTASLCEATGTGAHKKMSEVLKLDSTSAPSTMALSGMKDRIRMNGIEIPDTKLHGSGSFEDTQSGGEMSDSLHSPALKPTWLASPTVGNLKLPPSSSYDNFLKAAGC